MKRNLLALALTSALVPVAVLAQPASKPVAASTLVPRADIKFQTFTLPNGLTVVVHEDRKAPVVALHAWYNVGSKDEPEGRTGFAHLFEHIGLFNGTENLPGGLMEPLRALGATDWNGTTFFDRTNYFQTVPTAALERAMYMESDRMGHLLGALTQERLDNQRGVVQNEKRQNDNQPYGLTFYRMLENLFPAGHPYRHSTIGSMADLDAASLDDLRNWHRSKYGPNNAVLVLAGDIDVPTARRLVTKYFGHIPRGPANVPATASVPTLKAPISDRMTDRVSNTRLYRVWAVPGLLDMDSVALDVVGDALGGGASSRLDNELVRGDQTAVGVGASMIPFQRIGLFYVQVDVKPGADADAVGKRLDGIIADLAAKGPTADEVQKSVMSDVSGQIYSREQSGGFTGKAVVLAEGALYAKDPGFHQKRLRAQAALTPAKVRAVAAKWLGRPVYSLRVDPGERAAYAEAASNRPKPAPAAPIAFEKRGPMPDVGQVADLDFPTIERATLANGIPVEMIRRQSTPTTRIAVEFDAGIAADPAGRLGTQALMLNLLTEGTTTKSSLQLAEAQERLGANVGVQASMDRSAVILTALSPNLSPSLDLLADIIRNPAFAPGEVERIRATQLAGIAAEKTQPLGIARRAIPALLYGPDHPYGKPFSGTGTTEAVTAITRDELNAFHQQWVRPDNAKIFVVSDRPLAEIVSHLNAKFSDWPAPAAAKGTKSFATSPPAGKSRIVLIDRPQSPQSMIYAGSLLPVSGTDDLLYLNAANEILAGSFLARINQDIREKRGWSYGVSGFPQLAEHRMPWLLQAPVQSNQTGPSIAGILDHVKSFTTDKGVTAPELQRVVQGNMRQLAGSFETSAQLLNTLRTMSLQKRPDDYFEKIAARYRSMNEGMLDAAARGALDPNKMLFVVVGDAKIVRPQLEKLGLPIEEMKAN
jgi:zinc protease